MAVDISGRHEVDGRYHMVCAAVSLDVSPDFIERVKAVKILPRVAEAPDINSVADLIKVASVCHSGIIVAEKGDMYNLEPWRVSSILGRKFKHPESLGERAAVELAHHISLAGRRLILEGMG